LKPINATIHPVSVVPMFAPKIIPRAWRNVKSSAATNPTAATVVALELCNIAVAAVPVSSPDNGECVPRLNHPRNRSPASFLNPEVIAAIP
jgi:hypothetical protein